MDRIGVDVGGTFIKAGVVRDGRIVCKLSIPTENEKGTETILKNIAKAAVQAAEEAGKSIADFECAGFGIPGNVDDKQGVVVMCPNLGGWRQFPFKSEMEKLLPVKVFVGNDANCAVLGETVSGAAAGTKDAVMLTLGTGVGGGMVCGGHLITGHAGLGAELGHICLYPDGISCGCGMKGCIEAYCSVTALVRETKEKMNEFPDSLMHAFAKKEGSVDGRTSFECSKLGDLAACEVVEKYTDDLARAIGSLITTFRPEVFLLGGGLSNQGSYLTDKVNAKLSQYVFASGFAYVPKVKKALLGNDAGIIGAAYLSDY